MYRFRGREGEHEDRDRDLDDDLAHQAKPGARTLTQTLGVPRGGEAAEVAFGDAGLPPLGRRATIATPAITDRSSSSRLGDLGRLRATLAKLGGGGTALPSAVAARYAALLDADLSAVRIHASGAASDVTAELGARALTHGSHIAFAPGAYDEATADRDHVLAHELVHVVQNQRSGGAAMELAARLDVGPSGSAIEAEAEAGAHALTSGQAFSVTARSKLPGISLFDGPPPGKTGPVAPAGATGGTPTGTATPTGTGTAAPTGTTGATGPTTGAPPATTATATPAATNAGGTNAAPGVTGPVGPAGPTTKPGTPPATTTATPTGPTGPTAPAGPTTAPAAPAGAIDSRVAAILEQRADPKAKGEYSKSIEGVNVLRIQALQYSFVKSTLLHTVGQFFVPTDAFGDHYAQIYSANVYRGSSTSWYDADAWQSRIEGLRGVLHILGDIAGTISGWAGMVAVISGLLALITSETIIGGIGFGAIAAAADTVATITALVKIACDAIDVVLGVIQMIILVARARCSKDPAARARFAALLKKESGDFAANVTSIALQAAVIVATAGTGAAIGRTAERGFLKSFTHELEGLTTGPLKAFKEEGLKSITAKFAVEDVGKGVATGGRKVLAVEVEEGAVAINRQARVKGRLVKAREVVQFTSKNQMNGAKLVSVNKTLLRFAGKGAAGTVATIAAAQIIVETRAPSGAGAGPGAVPEAKAGRPSSLSNVQMWPSQIEKFTAAKAPLADAKEHAEEQLKNAKESLGDAQAPAVQAAFQKIMDAQKQQADAAREVQADAAAGKDNTDKGATTAQTGGVAKAKADDANKQMGDKQQKLAGAGDQLKPPPPKEGIINKIYNWTIGKISGAIGGIQNWIKNLVGKLVMSAAGFSKEELDMAGVENDMRMDSHKDDESKTQAAAVAAQGAPMQQKVYELQKDKTQDEQNAIQGMADSMQWVDALEEADKALATAIASGTAYMNEAAAIIAHEVDTQSGGKAIDAGYVGPITADADILINSLVDTTTAPHAKAQGEDSLNQMKAVFTSLDTSWGEGQLTKASADYQTKYDALAGQARSGAEKLKSAASAFIGTTDYNGCAANGAALDKLWNDFDTASDSLVTQLYSDVNYVINEYISEIQKAIDEANAATLPDLNAPPADDGPSIGPQRKAVGEATEAIDPVAVGARGISGSGGALPHLDTIQQSFGRHDVSSVQAHQGGTAAEASRELGASAYAMGNAVAFSGAPDLHTAAHEAAHVIQQRSGVQLAGGIDGGASDPHERHADAVADAVVAGKSVEALLGSGGSGATGTSVQRRPDPEVAARKQKAADDKAAAAEAAAEVAAESEAESEPGDDEPFVMEEEPPDEDLLQKVDPQTQSRAMAMPPGTARHKMLIDESWRQNVTPQEWEQLKPLSHNQRQVWKQIALIRSGVDDDPALLKKFDDAHITTLEQLRAFLSDLAFAQLLLDGLEPEDKIATAGMNRAQVLQYVTTVVVPRQLKENAAAEKAAADKAAGPASAPVSPTPGKKKGKGKGKGKAKVKPTKAPSPPAASFIPVPYPNNATMTPGSANMSTRDGTEVDSNNPSASLGGSHLAGRHLGGDFTPAPANGMGSPPPPPPPQGSAGALAINSVATAGASAGGAGADRNIVGIGEEVTFSSAGGESGTWSADGGTPTAANGDKFTWNAPGSAGNFSVKLTVGDKVVTKGMSVITPTSVKFTKLDEYGPDDDTLMGAGMTLDMQVFPLNVSFTKITIREQPGGASGLSGYFTGAVGDISHHPAVGPTLVRNNNKTSTIDDAHLLDDTSDPWAKPLRVGSMTWQIPYLYSAGSVVDQSFQIVAQTMSIVDSRHTVTVTKGGQATTRTPAAPTRPVARKATGGAHDVADPVGTATRGVAGSGGALPHLATIQESFGRHDVTGVQAHQGGAAARASQELGASAYAMGNTVAFANAPDLHTAAHEAAHVVQQRLGAAPAGLDGGVGDRHEQHADAVADAVVAGRSAESLLGSQGGRASTTAVQRKPGDPDPNLPQVSAEKLLPDDKNYQVLADGSVLVRNDWVLKAPDASPQGKLVKAPAEVAEILAAMKSAGVLSWMDSAQIPSLSQQLGIGEIDPNEKFTRVGVEISVYYLIGPPPGRDVIVSRNGGDLIAVIRQSVVSSGPITPDQEVNLSPTVRDEVLIAAEKYTKLKVDPQLRNQVVNGNRPWHTYLDPGRQGTYVTINQASAEALFGKQQWDGYLKKPATSGSGVLKENSGGAEAKPTWLPKGTLALDPLQPKYITHSSVTVEVQWDFSVSPDAGLILLPNHCDYSWTVKKNGKPVDSSSFAVFSDNRSTSLKLDSDPGTYEITLVATSDHFLTHDHTYSRSVTLTAISEEDFDKQVFDKNALGDNGAFTRDPKTGKLVLKPKQTALTTEQEIQTLELTRGAIDALLKQGKVTQSDHDVLVEQLDKQKGELEAVAKKVAGGTPYVVMGTFVGREDSSSTKLELMMHMMHRQVEAGQGTYSIILHDTTFGDPTQHLGNSSGAVAADTNAAFEPLEEAALVDMADDFHAHNDLPSGTVHLAAQMLTAGRVWETTRDTDNGRKTAKKVLGGAAMVGGVALMIVPGADVASAPMIIVGNTLMVGTALATAASVAIEVEDRISKEGELKFDRRLVLDVLQIVAVALPFGTMTRVFEGMAPVGKTGMFAAMLGIDAAQGFIIAGDVRDQLRLIDANAAQAAATATSPEQKAKIFADRDRKIANVLGGAMVNGAFILISLGAGIKRVAAATHAGISIQIREPVVNIKEQGRVTMEETLKRGWFEHENERVMLSDEERTFLEQEVEALKVAEGGSGGGKDDKGGGKDDKGGGKDNKGGAGGKDNKPPEPDAKTADDLKKYADAEQQQGDMAAAKNGTATKEQRDRLAQDLRRQVPDIALVDAVRTGDAKTVISVVTPGGGDFGIKRMNDELISYQFNSNRLIPGRNKIIKDAFEAQGFKIVDQNYKTTTFVSDKAPVDTTAGMDAASKQVDAQMKPLLEQVLAEATEHFKADVAKRTAPDPEIALGKARIEKMAELRKQVEKKDFTFDFQMGAAELKGGKDATYEDILGSEMNATKGAIMARDKSIMPEGGRAMVFSDTEFATFAKETVAIKERLTQAQATLPYHGQRLTVFEGGSLNRDILRAVRKGSYHETLNDLDKKTLESVEQYFKRVNSLDYIKHFTGDEVGAQGQKVADTAALIKQLESDKPLSKEAADQIQATLSQGTPQADAANEAQFYAKAATLHERVVLNADIKDMGLDLFEGYEKSINTIGTDPKADVNSVSQHASDNIVDFKRNAANAFKKFYTEELLPRAKDLARQQKRQDILDALDKESEPLILLGGDEITVSLNKSFEELGLLPEAVAKLTSPDVANARVAVTKTGDGPGAAGHVAAMKSAQGGQDLLKKEFEPLARDLRAKAARLSPDQAAKATALADRIDRMYTEERSGKTQIMELDGSVADTKRIETDARALLDAKEEPASSSDKKPPPGGSAGSASSTVPQNRDEVRAFIASKYADVVTKYQQAPKTARAEYLPLIEEIKKFQPGELGGAENKAKAKDLMDRWAAIGKQIASEPAAQSTEAADLRTLYNLIEKNDMPAWQQALEQQGVSKEEQARLGNMHRTEAKVFVRDTMTDANSKEFLYLRDLAIYGDRTGPTFDKLMQEKMKSGMTQEQAYDAIIASSQRSNPDVNKGLTGSDTGIKKDSDSQ